MSGVRTTMPVPPDRAERYRAERLWDDRLLRDGLEAAASGETVMHPTPEDHVAIVDLLARYCLALDHDDVDGWVALFTPDARYEVYGRSFDGHEGLRGMLAAAPGGLHLGGQRPAGRLAGC